MASLWIGRALFFGSALNSLPLSYAAPPACDDPPRLLASTTLPKPREHLRPPTTLPPDLGITVPFQEFGCQREFRLRGKSRFLDSPHRQDAEGLREAFQNTPESLALLDSYQDTKKAAQHSAYLGTVGLAIFLLGPVLIDHLMKNEKGEPQQGAKSVKKIAFWGGLGIAGGAFGYSFAVLRMNDRKLDEALAKYNDSNPRDSLEFQFSTSVFF